LLLSAGSFEQASMDTANPMQPIKVVMKRAAFPLVGAMGPFLSDSDSPHGRGSRDAQRANRAKKFIPDLRCAGRIRQLFLGLRAGVFNLSGEYA
jgi:hypothetical protein